MSSEELARAALRESMRINGDSTRQERRQQSQETINAEAGWEFEQLHKELNELRDKIESLEHERDRALRWGIGTLGMAVLSMGVYIMKLLKLPP